MEPTLEELSETTRAIKKQRLAKKSVRFAETLEKIHLLPPNSVEAKEVDEGEEEDPIEPTAEETRCTSEYTVLASQHGEARRKLREITIHDLQSAVKYGIKTRARNCPKTKMPRWKYVYGNMVYITDHTSRHEVTSYKQPIEICPATITPEWQHQHDKDLKTLQQDPFLCETHSIIVIDESASMKTSDVKGFRNRSQAAYGVLALEYIASQIIARGVDGSIDAVSVIEMNDNGRIIIDREPLDWILFNKILRRQMAKPKSHGNYNNSLVLAKKLIEREVGSLRDLQPDEVPTFAIVFLSDGRPSDCNNDDHALRLRILQEIAVNMKANFCFHAIGLGPADEEFKALKDMCESVKSCETGSEASFSTSQLTANHLASVFSAVSSSVTATRTERQTASTKSPQEKKKVQLRSKSVPSAERSFRVYDRDVTHWRYDNFQNHEWPWKRLKFRNQGACAFEMETKPFGQGTERLAYMFHEIDDKRKRIGKPMVAKETITIDDEERKISFHETFCRVQFQASELAKEFNNVVSKTPALFPLEKEIQVPIIEFINCSVYEYRADDEMLCGFLVEPFLKGIRLPWSSKRSDYCYSTR